MKKIWNHFFSAQFLGVFNDNLLKNLICFVSVLWISEDQRANVIALASALMVFPFIFLSPLAGKLSGVHSKSQIFKKAKVFEIPIVALACLGFISESMPTVLFAMFLMGIQSALYSPAKYGLIKELSENGQIGRKLGKMELLSFTAVLVGALIAGCIADMGDFKNIALTVMMLVVAVVGYLNSRNVKSDLRIEKKEHTTINPLKFIVQQSKITKKFKGVNNAIVGLGLFWFIASLLQMNLLIHCPLFLRMSNSQTGIVSAVVAVGIGLGCYVSGKFNQNRVALGLLFPSLFLLAIAVLCIGLFSGTTIFIAGLILAAFFGGMFKIPLNTWIQEKTPQKEMGNVLALSNMVVFISILLSAVAFALLDLFFTSNEIFLIIGAFALVVSLGVLVLDPISILRLIIKGITKLLYKTKVSGFQNIPQNKGGIIVVNHVSMLDSLVVLNAINRNVRFVMHDAVYHQKSLNPLFKRCKMIPVSSGKSKSALQDFTFRVKKEIDLGHLVCIFPEGQLGRTGQLMPFKKGIEMLVKLTGAPVLPLHIQGMIGSPLSYKIGENKRYTFHPKNWRKEVRVEVGSLIEVEKNERITAFEIRQTVKELEVVNINNLIKNKDKSKVLKQTVDALFGFSNNLKLNSNNALELILQSPNYTLKDLMKNENLYLGTKEGTAGKPIPGVQVKVLKKNLSHCKENEIGELHVLNAYSENFKWINTSCLGSIDECGFVTICNEVQL